MLKPEACFLNESYGITEERRIELSGMMDRAFGGPMRIMTSQHMVDIIADLADTKEEFAFCLVEHVALIAKRDAFL